MGKNLKTKNQTEQVFSKVPEITILFWITKVLTTGMGETFSDFLVHQAHPAIMVAIVLVALTASMILQFSVRRYISWVYWLNVIMVSVFGTMAADVLHAELGIPYVASTAFFVAALTVIFVLWYKSEKTLSIHSIYTRRREGFYWATVLATFALGTATGDMTATTLHLGYFSSGVLFAVLIALPAVAYKLFRLNEIAAFWIAYILTRPLGASFADWMGVTKARGGLDFGTGPVSLTLILIIIVLISAQTIAQNTIARKNIARKNSESEQ
jgi:uncharacterized membrane-anchored protein